MTGVPASGPGAEGPGSPANPDPAAATSAANSAADPVGSARGPGAASGPPRWGLPARLAAAAAGGAALFLAFPPIDAWYLAPPGIALLALSVYGVRPRRAFLLGYVFGVAFLLPSLAWVLTIGVDGWAGLVAVESLFYALLGQGVALTSRLPLRPLWGAALWVAVEWARGVFPFGGFPWSRVAFSQGESAFTRYASLGGAPLVTFAVALCGGLLAVAALAALRAARRPRPGARPLARLLALPLAGALVLPAAGAFAIPRPGDEGRAVDVGIVQGNVPGRGMYPLGDEPAVVLRNHNEQIHAMARAVREGRLPRPDLVVLPENSTDIDPYRDEYARSSIDAAVKDIGVPVMVGAVVAIGDEHRATRSLVWDPVTGPGAYYDKQKLVPFGEFTPFKDLVLTLFERARLVGRQSVAGTRDGDLRMGPVTIGAVNCYEVAFDDVVRDTVRAGGTPLAVQTNNATYALSNLPPQQLAMSKLRAVEHNRAVVTAATTGISAFVTPDGKVAWRTGELVADHTVVTVPVRSEHTVATTVGAMPEWALILLGACAVGAALLRARRGPAGSDGRR
ncbi:apolipoprotein N-acyltransferase [Spongiactinospora sp. TRM90649]|uniref:apolipoprotein N-acyltransferase n=1 Tax=Spongiactinospora sp. TRM90649 TaxID=3031114 RepID=UPI0023F92C6E|nr:apolipoprotein N-acyltransferase [Spongiactinospora sp. TRM90649]MDF5756729.1 apolipoprotein N-acyltransferase [Spongiactinospora sp. TRM90649]